MNNNYNIYTVSLLHISHLDCPIKLLHSWARKGSTIFFLFFTGAWYTYSSLKYPQRDIRNIPIMPSLTSTIACINSRWRRQWRKGGKRNHQTRNWRRNKIFCMRKFFFHHMELRYILSRRVIFLGYSGIYITGNLVYNWQQSHFSYQR